MSCERVCINGYAKINLYLEVVGRHPSGKHLLQTVMHTVSLCDRVTVAAADEIALRCYGDFAAPEDSSNIAYRCAEAFFHETGLKGGAAIEIEKHIPTQAGLGGGSADGAAVLRGLNVLYGCGLSVEELCRIGAGVGADIPFCTAGGCGHCTGFGEIIEPLPVMNGCIVLAKGSSGISTAEAYGKIDVLLEGVDCIRQDMSGKGDVSGKSDVVKGRLREDIRESFGRGGNVLGAAGECCNIFEQVTENADVSRIK
ncbi:MAG: 4-(cytidine 5'-diphospho)-2-C-methyl-D-erythritol kinase, partial [Oscillospiraceae bacterium]|nr:4-(cytidine 5'-diphospho)-2-C-methyl-D-erythritol kinase [Oscillospiraceae bacterium]